MNGLTMNYERLNDERFNGLTMNYERKGLKI